MTKECGEETFKFHASTAECDQPPITIALNHEGGSLRARGHFERLVNSTIAVKVEERWEQREQARLAKVRALQQEREASMAALRKRGSSIAEPTTRRVEANPKRAISDATQAESVAKVRRIWRYRPCDENAPEEPSEAPQADAAVPKVRSVMRCQPCGEDVLSTVGDSSGDEEDTDSSEDEVTMGFEVRVRDEMRWASRQSRMTGSNVARG